MKANRRFCYITYAIFLIFIPTLIFYCTSIKSEKNENGQKEFKQLLASLPKPSIEAGNCQPFQNLFSKGLYCPWVTGLGENQYVLLPIPFYPKTKITARSPIADFRKTVNFRTISHYPVIDKHRNIMTGIKLEPGSYEVIATY